jgi:hypothetical protein
MQPKDTAGRLAPDREGIGLVAAALILPVFAGTVLFFVNSTALALVIGMVTVITSAGLVAIDARRLGNIDLNGRVREVAGSEAAGILFAGMVIMWIVVYPIAFFRRRHFARPNLTLPAVAVSVFFGLGPILYSIHVTHGPPPCASSKVTDLVEKAIHESSVGVLVNSIDGYREFSHDRDVGVRHCRCVVHTDSVDYEADYSVRWYDRDSWQFAVEVPMGVLPSCRDPEIVQCLERLIDDTPNPLSERSTENYQEVSYDPVVYARKCQCIAHTGDGETEIEYLVVLPDPFKKDFEVQLLDQ